MSPSLPRVAVFGGRDYGDSAAVDRALDAVVAKLGPIVIVHGQCRGGADLFAAQYARRNGLEEDPFPANWDEHGRGAGPIRNAEMARSGLSGAIGFPGGRGTRDMAKQCELNAVEVWWPAGR